MEALRNAAALDVTENARIIGYVTAAHVIQRLAKNTKGAV